MRPLAIILLVLAAAPLSGRAASAVGAPEEPPQQRSPQASPQQEPPPPPAEPPPAKGGETYVTGDDRDFEPEVPARSLALGPVGRGDLLVSLDLGWLRSGLRADLGLGSWIDLTLRADTLLLYDRFRGQSGIYAGVRASPTSQGLFRASAELSVGQVFVPGDATMANLTAFRGSATAGLVLDLATLYGRADIRWVSNLKPAGPGWTRDAELGAGVERAFGRFVVGAEGFVWARPGLSGLGQWRVRVGMAI
ncbi:hypothetical protein [Anaeromyxobacter terrae]|uniref:hypothetical protein n=1 Tax=Anaeromyxobacter terrae TaxID=2925406 RepID=UPI001F58E7EF|nr:hypothetical protein [Anaeromyxobacter sp. SG22]